MMREDGNLRLVSVFLAGGVGRRFGGNKLLADAGGAPVLARLFERVLPVLRRRSQRVFLIAHDPACAVLGEERGLSVITGTFPQKSDTVRAAVQAAGDADGILFLQSDQMLLSGESLKTLITAWEAAPDLPARLSFDGVPGSPALFPASYFPKLLSLSGDRGGSALLRGAPVTLVSAADANEGLDADTKEALHQMVQILQGKTQSSR